MVVPPIAGWVISGYFVENPIMDDLGVPPFQETFLVGETKITLWYFNIAMEHRQFKR